MPGKNINDDFSPDNPRQILPGLLINIFWNMEVIALQMFFIQIQMLGDKRIGFADMPVFTIKIKGF
jgi:hypothetical protein